MFLSITIASTISLIYHVREKCQAVTCESCQTFVLEKDLNSPLVTASISGVFRCFEIFVSIVSSWGVHYVHIGRIRDLALNFSVTY